MSENRDYLEFNTQSIEQLIKQKLVDKFPDVEYSGSSANILTESIASTFSLLLYQLNRSASNSAFNKTQSVDSLIQITKILGYNPIGYIASNMFIDGIVRNASLTAGASYTIPRYSIIDTVNGSYSTKDDITFVFDGDNDNYVFTDATVYGGVWVEHPQLISDGLNNQQFTISDISNKVDHNLLDVYVKTDNGWEAWSRVDSLFLSDSNDKHFEARLNTRGTYDITFGNGINGSIPPENSVISIFYFSVTQVVDIMDIASVDSGITRMYSNTYTEIMQDILKGYDNVIYDWPNAFNVLNSSINTKYSTPENLEEIRRNAPMSFQTQNRLVTKSDFSSYITNNFSNSISDILVLDNQEFVDTYLKYYSYDMDIDDPHTESRALFNQLNFSDSCNFNNIYVFIIPLEGKYLSRPEKKMIIESVNDKKVLTAQVIPSDPIYIEYGVAVPTTEINPTDLETSYLEITKNYYSNRSDSDVLEEVYETIVDYFDYIGSTFNDNIDIDDLDSKLLNIDGVYGITTINGDVRVDGAKFYQFNPYYPDKVFTTPPTTIFTKIFVPSLFDNNLRNKMVIKTNV